VGRHVLEELLEGLEPPGGGTHPDHGADRQLARRLGGVDGRLRFPLALLLAHGWDPRGSQVPRRATRADVPILRLFAGPASLAARAACRPPDGESGPHRRIPAGPTQGTRFDGMLRRRDGPAGPALRVSAVIAAEEVRCRESSTPS